MNQNAYIDWQGDGRFCVVMDNFNIGIEASCRGQHYSRWIGMTPEQARLLGNSLLTAADELEAEIKERDG